MKKNVENITILIGPNGSGKTTYIRNKKKEFDPNDIFSLDTEELTFLHNKTTSPFEKEIKEIANKLIERELEKELELEAKKVKKGQENVVSDKEKVKRKKRIKDNQDAKWLELNKNIRDIIKKNDEIQSSINNLIGDTRSSLIQETDYFKRDDFVVKKQLKIQEPIISGSWVFEFMKETIHIDNAPSGVKKVLLLYLQIIKYLKKAVSTKKKILFVIEEIENYLHPSWIKICIFILKNIFDMVEDDKTEGLVSIVISTHSPEVLVLLGEYIENFATPKNFGEDIDRMDLNLAMGKFNEIINECGLNSKRSPVSNIEDYILEIKSILSFEFGRFIFEKNSPVIICEGITDQLLIRNHTKSLVTNTFGYYNFGIYMSLYFGLYKKWNQKWRIMADGDGKLDQLTSSQAKFKEYFINKVGLEKRNVFYFVNDLEEDLYNRSNVKDAKIKFKLLREKGLGMEKDAIKKANEDFYNFLFETPQEENN